MSGKGLQLKAIALLVSFLWLVNNRIVDHLERCGLFSDFQYGIMSSRSIADLLTVVSDRIARDFNSSVKFYGISGQVFGLIFSFLSNRWLQVVLNGKSSQEHLVNSGVPQGSTFGPTLFLLYINDLPDDVICNTASTLMILLSTLSVIRHLICSRN